MDGGRIFRAALALLGVKRATVYATRLSQILAVLMGLIALTTGNIILLVISALVFSHAVQELLRDRTISAAQGIRVREVMTDAPYLQSFTHGTTVSSAFAIALKSLQPAFAVLHSENVVGVLDREVLLSSAALEAEESYVAEHMNREFPIASPEDELATILDRFAGDDSRAIVVLLDSKFVGMVFRDRALEYLVVQGVRKKTKEQAAYLEEEW